MYDEDKHLAIPTILKLSKYKTPLVTDFITEYHDDINKHLKQDQFKRISEDDSVD